MPKMIQLRNVPDDLHRKLKARAALTGMSLSDYPLIIVPTSPPRFPSGRKPRAVPLGTPTSVGTWGRRTSVLAHRPEGGAPTHASVGAAPLPRPVARVTKPYDPRRLVIMPNNHGRPD